MVQIEFGNDLDAAVQFVEENNLDARLIFDTSPKEAREQLDEMRAEDAREDADANEEPPAGGLH